jgi:hypothetical protein
MLAIIFRSPTPCARRGACDLNQYEVQTVEDIDTSIWQAFEQLAEGYPDDEDVRMIVNLAQWLQQNQPRLKEDSG